MCTANNASVIIIKFDRYIFPSIKDNEHLLKGMTLANFCLSGPEQIRPADFAHELKNVNFKEAFVHFIIDDWNNNYMAPFIGNKQIFINLDQCYEYEVTNERVQKIQVIIYLAHFTRRSRHQNYISRM